MEEFEMVETAEGLTAGREANLHVDLTPAEKVTLAQWYGSPAYNVFIKLANGEIEKSETYHFQTWKNKKLFYATGLKAVAIRDFFEKLQSEMNHQIDEFAGEVEFVKQTRLTEQTLKTSPEEMIQQSFGV